MCQCQCRSISVSGSSPAALYTFISLHIIFLKFRAETGKDNSISALLNLHNKISLYRIQNPRIKYCDIL